MVKLQDIMTRFFDQLALWKEEWLKFSDSEKSVYCSPSTGENTVVKTFLTETLCVFELLNDFNNFINIYLHVESSNIDRVEC